eukprot:m.39472 g.39472  ORF g.39472 m.39472 type:complete len:261 (+) comp14717_c0_seq1:234-1016(+)
MASAFSALLDCFSLAHLQFFGDTDSTTTMADRKRQKLAHMRCRASLYAEAEMSDIAAIAAGITSTENETCHPKQILNMWSEVSDWHDICDNISDSDTASISEGTNQWIRDREDHVSLSPVTPQHGITDVQFSPPEYVSSTTNLNLSTTLSSLPVPDLSAREGGLHEAESMDWDTSGSDEHASAVPDSDSTEIEDLCPTEKTTPVRTRRLQSVFNVARRWRISAQDAAEIMENVERAITPEGKLFGPDSTVLSYHGQCIKC